jgi:hypothetical protein
MPFHRGRLDLAGTPPPSFGVLGTVKFAYTGGQSTYPTSIPPISKEVLLFFFKQ